MILGNRKSAERVYVRRLFPIENYVKAEEYLLKAYMFEGKEIFEDEEKNTYRVLR